MSRTKHLETEKIGKLLLNFSIPAIIGTVINSLYNVVDRIYIGQGVGTDGLAAVTIVFPIMMLMMSTGMLIAYGTNALISIRLGEKNQKEAELLLGQAFTMFFLRYLLFAFFGLLFLDKILIFLGASKNILPMAKEYATIILIGNLFQSIAFGGNSFIRSEGSPKVAMVTMLIGGISNIILDPIFIFYFKMGIKGAAIATILSMIISSLWVLKYYLSTKSHLKLKLKNFKIKFYLLKKVLAVGSPPFFLHFAGTIVLMIINNRLKIYGGDLAISVMGVIFTINMLIFMPMMGLSQGAQPIFGYNYGAKNYDRVRHTLILTLITATIICIIGELVFQFLPNILFIPFNKNPEFIKLGEHSIKIFMVAFPIIGSIFVTSNYFQAIGKPKISLLLTITRQIFLLIPLLLILPKIYGLNGIWYSGPISDVGAFTISIFFLIKELKKLSIKN